MGVFDNLKNQAANAIGQAASNPGGSGGKTVSVVFSDIPETLSGFTALPQAAMSTPFDTAAMVAAALCVYPVSKDESIAMLNFLKGPQPLNPREISFIADRMSQNNKAGFIGASYFNGATPQNNYIPSEPYTIVVSDGPYSYQEEGYAVMKLKSGGADHTRDVKLRKAKDGKWYLWDHGLLVDIRQPESTNPWE